jgi:2-methylisocitrate lyase-like PEP mutase family enzyme
VTNPIVDLLTAAKQRRSPLILTALLIQQVGFRAVYLTGAGYANARFGFPDIGLTTLTELVGHVSAVADAVDLPIVVDADAGFGNPINVGRTVRLLERAGASAIQLEDQVEPKKCGHFADKQVIPTADMVHKIEAAIDARTGDVAIIARTDSAAVHGIDDALARARSYRDAGADILFIEAPTSSVDIARIPREVEALHLVNLVEGGLTPMLAADELGALGFAAALYANATMRGAMFGARRVLQHLAATGSTEGVLSEMISWDDRQQLVRKPEFDALSAKYST